MLIESTDESLDGLVKRFCAPLFATDRFLQAGHSNTSINATMTFVKRGGRFYGVTCHHVLSAFFSEAVRKKLPIVPSLHLGRLVRQLGFIGEQGKYKWSVHSCREFPEPSHVDDDEVMAELDRANRERPDVAIADLTAIWEQLVEKRAALAIDLDAWTAPNWSSFQDVFLAFGYPDGHKYIVGDKVAAPFPRVAAKLKTAPPSSDKPHFTLCSTLEVQHGFGFSGLSGGPVLALHGIDDKFQFVGLT